MSTMYKPNPRYGLIGKPKIGGAIFRAPLGTALPTSEATALTPAFLYQGALSDAGVEQSTSKGYQSIKDWNGDEFIKSRTDHSVSLSFTLIEALNPEVQKTVYGGQATVTPATASTGAKTVLGYTGEDQENSVWVFDVAFQGRVRRIVAPNAQDTTGDRKITYKSSELTAYAMELSLYQDDAGVYFYEYSDDGIKAGA